MHFKILIVFAFTLHIYIYIYTHIIPYIYNTIYIHGFSTEGLFELAIES